MVSGRIRTAECISVLTPEQLHLEKTPLANTLLKYHQCAQTKESVTFVFLQASLCVCSSVSQPNATENNCNQSSPSATSDMMLLHGSYRGPAHTSLLTVQKQSNLKARIVAEESPQKFVLFTIKYHRSPKTEIQKVGMLQRPDQIFNPVCSSVVIIIISQALWRYRPKFTVTFRRGCSSATSAACKVLRFPSRLLSLVVIRSVDEQQTEAWSIVRPFLLPSALPILCLSSACRSLPDGCEGNSPLIHLGKRERNCQTADQWATSV